MLRNDVNAGVITSFSNANVDLESLRTQHLAMPGLLTANDLMLPSFARMQVLQVTSVFKNTQQDLTRFSSKQQLRWLTTLAYRESTCTNLNVSCAYEITVYQYSGKHICYSNERNQLTILFIPLIYGTLGKRTLSNIQPTVSFH